MVSASVGFTLIQKEDWKSGKGQVLNFCQCVFHPEFSGPDNDIPEIPLPEGQGQDRAG